MSTAANEQNNDALLQFAKEHFMPKSESDKKENTDKNDENKAVRIYIDGCWDVCHSGHYNAIRQARNLGGKNVKLILGIHDDTEIEAHKRKPVMNNEERLAVVKACKWVDEVVFGVPYAATRELIEREDIRCDWIAHGDDIPIAADGKSAYHHVMDKLKIFKRTPGVSTTDLITRLLNAVKADDNHETGKLEVGRVKSWSQFLATSHRLAAFSNSRVPKPGDTVVYVDGVFDLFHVGHVEVLQKARALGDFLYVGIYDDTLVQQERGTYWPIQNLQERTLNVLACRYVDEVIIGCPWEITEEELNVLGISIVAISANTLLKDTQMERYNVPKNKGILKEIETTCKLTTKTLARRMLADHENYEKQNKARVQKQKAYETARTYVEES